MRSKLHSIPTGPDHQFGPLRRPGMFMDNPVDADAGVASGSPTGTVSADDPSVQRSASDQLLAADEATRASNEERASMADLIATTRSLTARFAELMEEKQGPGADVAAINARLQALDNENKELRREVEDLGGRMRRKAAVPDTDDLFERRADGSREAFSIMRCVQAAAFGWDAPGLKNTPEHKAIGRFIEEKALPHDTIGNLGVVIPSQYINDWIERLSARTVSFTLGARFIPNLSGAPVEWPKVQGGAASEWIGENAEPTDSEITVSTLRLNPKELASSAPLTKRLLRMSAGEAQGLIEDDLARAHGEQLDLGILSGTGGDAAPLGILNVPGVGQTPFDGSSPDPFPTGALGIEGTTQNITDYLDVMVARTDSRDAYDSGGSMGWACHPLTLNKMRRAKDQDGRPLLVSVQGNGALPATNDQGAALGSGPRGQLGGTNRGMLWGHPVATTTNLTYGAASDLIFGNWADVLVGGWGPLEIEVSDNYQNYFKLRRLLILMTQLVDAGLRHPESFEIATNFDATSLNG